MAICFSSGVGIYDGRSLLAYIQSRRPQDYIEALEQVILSDDIDLDILLEVIEHLQGDAEKTTQEQLANRITATVKFMQQAFEDFLCHSVASKLAKVLVSMILQKSGLDEWMISHLTLDKVDRMVTRKPNEWKSPFIPKIDIQAQKEAKETWENIHNKFSLNTSDYVVLGEQQAKDHTRMSLDKATELVEKIKPGESKDQITKFIDILKQLQIAK